MDLSSRPVDPTASKDLAAYAKEDLLAWLRIERNALADYEPGEARRDQRARWASGRVRRLESELERRDREQN